MTVRGQPREMPWAAVPLVLALTGAALPIILLFAWSAGLPGIDVSSLAPALGFALSGAVVGTTVGVLSGVIAGTLDAPGRRWAIAVSAVLLAAPPAFWWIGLTRVPGFGRLSGGPAAGVVAGVALAPLTLLLIIAAAREVPSNAYEAARLSLDPVRRLWFVLLPLLRSAVVAGFLLTAILLLGESEIPFLFGFRTSMTDVVTTFSRTFDTQSTLPIIVPLVLAVLSLAMLMVRPLFDVMLTMGRSGRGVLRKRAGTLATASLFILPGLLCLSLGGYVRAAFSGIGGERERGSLYAWGPPFFGGRARPFAVCAAGPWGPPSFSPPPTARG